MLWLVAANGGVGLEIPLCGLFILAQVSKIQMPRRQIASFHAYN